MKYNITNTMEAAGHVHQYQEVIAHQHEITLYPHSHTVNIQPHQHSLTIHSHTHDFTIPGHIHQVEVPAHAHEITPGIYTYGNPQRFGLYVNGEKKADFEGRDAELDITSLLVGDDHMIPRGNWLSLEVRPNDLAYVSMDLIVQGFIQSRGDNTV